MRLTCYALVDHAPKLIAARPQRRWMDAFPDRHPYRCLPLSIANAHGWEVLCPVPIRVEWNGGPNAADLTVEALKPLPGNRPIEHFCKSNFTRGIVTFHVDYIFRTEPGWDLLTSGPVNEPKDNAYPLTGVIETDWLPYPFTMNWQMLRPGQVTFEEGEPYCFIFPVPKQALLELEPEIRSIRDDPELAAQHEAFRTSRDEFMERFHAGDQATLKQAWQRHYFLGRHPDGRQVEDHLNKLRLKEPVDLRRPVAAGAPAEPRRPPRLRSVVDHREANPAPESPASASASTIVDAMRPAATSSQWEAGSPLERIPDAQTAQHLEGRARVDAEGRLLDRSRTTLIRSQAEAAGRDFLVLENLLSADQCEVITKAFGSLEDRLFKSDAIDPYWNNRFIWLADVLSHRPEAARIMIDAGRRAAENVTRFYGLKLPVYSDLMQIVRWMPGMFMRWHADNANPDGSHHHMAHRAFSGITYLNDEYEGGELYFTAHDIAIKPKRGMFVAFTGGFHHEHAVLQVLSGKPRLTMPMFFSFDRAKADRTLYPELEPA